MTIFALFSDQAAAGKAVDALNSSAAAVDNITLIGDAEMPLTAQAAPQPAVTSPLDAQVVTLVASGQPYVDQLTARGLGEELAGFFARAVEDGGVVVAVDSEMEDAVAEILESHRGRVTRT